MIENSGVVMRRRGTPEVLDLATALVRVDAGPLLRRALPLAIPVAMATGLGWLLDPWLGVVAGVLVARLGQLPALLAASDRAAGRVPSLAWSRLLSGWAALAPGALLYALGYVLGSPLLVLPPYLWLRGLFRPEVVVLERPEGGAGARLGSFMAGAVGEILVTRMWQVAIEAWFMVGVALTGEFVIEVLFQLGAPLGSLLEGEASPLLVVGSFLAQPLLSVFRFCSYLDIRTRREGLDAWFLLWSAANREPSR